MTSVRLSLHKSLEKLRPQGRHARTVLVAVLAMAAAGGLGYYFARPHWEARKHLEQAREALINLEVDDAKTHLDFCQSVWPSDAEVAFLLGRVARLSSDFPACHRNLQDARRLGWDPAAVDLEYLLIKAQQAGSITEETRALNDYLQKHLPEEPLVLEALAMGAYRSSRLDKAFSYLNAWEKQYPADWRPWLLRGVLHHGIGQFGPAVFDLKRALALRPGHNEALRFLGLSLANTGDDYQEAVRCLETYLQTNPDSAEILLALAQAKRGLNLPAEAQATLGRLLNKEPDDPAGLLLLAQLEADADRLTEALALVRRVENLNQSGDKLSTSDSCRVVHLNASLARLLGRDSEAEAYEKKLTQMKAILAELSWAVDGVINGSGDVDLYRKIGILYLRLGVEKEGKKWLANVFRTRPNDSAAHRALAEFYEQRPDAESKRQAALHRRQAEGK